MASPVAIVDIGSNSVRLVAYEALSRAPVPIFNEKSLCALGHGVVTTGRLPQEGIDKAIAALKRFRVICDMLGTDPPMVIATAAARDAKNGPDFLKAATAAIQAPVTLLSGPREAELSALGVLSGIHKPDGVVGDLGGGSLELIDVKGTHPGKGTSLPLGGLALMDASGRSTRAASKIVRDALGKSRVLEKLAGRTFYAVGGTWRALARLHMRQRNYPVHVMHGYGIPAREAADFAGLVERVDVETLLSIDAVSAARRPLLAYGAIVLEEVIRAGQPKEVTISTAGVREGLLYERLDAASRRADPLLTSAADYNRLLSRAPRHAEDLCGWTDRFMQSTHLEETVEERRLRHAACLLSDVNWRAHPDYRSVQGLNLVANASFSAIDHPGRAFLALATAYRHLGPFEDPDFQIRALASPRALDRARILGAALRVAYLVSAGQPDVLPRTPMVCAKSKVRLELPDALADLGSERIYNRVRQLARLIGRDAELAA